MDFTKTMGRIVLEAFQPSSALRPSFRHVFVTLPTTILSRLDAQDFDPALPRVASNGARNAKENDEPE